MDTDRIPTEPTIDREPPDASSLVSGPSQAQTSAAAGRGRRTMLMGTVVGLALVATFSAGIGVGRLSASPSSVSDGSTPSPASSTASAPTTFGLIREAWDTIHQQYVDRSNLDDQALIYGAIKGMTQAVGDTGHTDFMTPQERKQRDDALSGSFVGIGVRIDLNAANLPRIVEVFKGSPAEKASLAVDDVILAADGKTTNGHTIDEIAGWIRGEAGTTVTLTVRHGDTGPERSVPIVRADVPLHPVTWAMVPGSSTALVSLDEFSSGSADAIVAALKAAKAAGAQRIVLDLRGNPGGYVNEAIGVASQFLTKGLVFIERNAQGGETKHPVSPGGVATDLPLTVIVDGDTASAAEIVSGAIQDAGRGSVVGQTTYGTGTVLGEFGLSDGSALRIGTVEWLTPNGRRIWHEGIAPDVPVTRPTDVRPLTPDQVAKMTPAEVAAMTDQQLKKALDVVATEPAPSG